MLLNFHWFLRKLYSFLPIFLPVEDTLHLCHSSIVQFKPIRGFILGILDINYFSGLIIQQNGLKRATYDRLVGVRYLFQANLVEAYEVYVTP